MATGLLSSQLAYNWRRNTSAILGSAIILACEVAVVFGPSLVAQNPYDVMQLDLMDSYLPPAWMDGGNPKYWLGTDGQGRDVLAAVVYGTRISALIGLAATLMSCVIGTFLGLMAGYFGGWIDAVIMRVADVLLAIPGLLLSLALITALGFGTVNAAIAVGIASVA